MFNIYYIFFRNKYISLLIYLFFFFTFNQYTSIRDYTIFHKNFCTEQFPFKTYILYIIILLESYLRKKRSKATVLNKVHSVQEKNFFFKFLTKTSCPFHFDFSYFSSIFFFYLLTFQFKFFFLSQRYYYRYLFFCLRLFSDRKV